MAVEPYMAYTPYAVLVIAHLQRLTNLSKRSIAASQTRYSSIMQSVEHLPTHTQSYMPVFMYISNVFGDQVEILVSKSILGPKELHNEIINGKGP